jgi:Lipase maturation factor
MQWFEAPGYWVSRLLLERSIAAVYVIGFVVAANQFPALLGERGLLPAPRFLSMVSFREAPSIFHLHYSDRFLRVLAWLAVWVLYLSIVNVGQTFYAFGWESLLLEAGFLAIFLGPADLAPPTVVLLLSRWLLFRLEFGAGLIKLRGDRCWRDLTCLGYHYETQPMPNPLSWYFHHLPRPIHRLEVLGNHAAQLVAPFLLFGPQPLAGAGAMAIMVHQGWLILSGNFSWLNALTLALAFAALDDRQLGAVFWFPPRAAGVGAAVVRGGGVGLRRAAACVELVAGEEPAVPPPADERQLQPVAPGQYLRRVRRRHQAAIRGRHRGHRPAPAHRLHRLAGVPVQGQAGDPRRRPLQVAPYHLRLDWLLWFAAMSPPIAHPWVVALAEKLLMGDQATLKLLRRNPFPTEPPTFLRARLYRYRFTTWRERRRTRAWWTRFPVAEYLPPLRLQQPVRDKTSP